MTPSSHHALRLSDVLIAVVVILVLSASMSTLSSLVLASSSTLTLDFLKDNLVRDMDEKKQVAVMRGLIVVSSPSRWCWPSSNTAPMSPSSPS